MPNQKHPMMKCGHRANGIAKGPDDTETPICVLCGGLTDNAEITVPEPDLSKRIAKCCYCNREKPSDSKLGLAFFEHCPSEEFDSYYCGCRGWD